MVLMTNTNPTARTINIEDMKVGFRYAEVIAPRYERNFTVASVEHFVPGVQPWRNGQFVDITLVKVTYEGGMSITHEIGTPVYVECEVAK
jgi:hypothetical protein